MALISRKDDLKDLELRTKNNGKRPLEQAGGKTNCMFHMNKNCGCSKCRDLKIRLETSK